MSWRVESRTEPGRWVEYDGTQWTADPDTQSLLLIVRNDPQPLTPVGPVYTPTGPNDNVALFLAATGIVPTPSVSGSPPAVPKVPPVARGVVY
ncbi:hypothetical protein M2271_003529 [Streptomyces sp. LBL]|nr:hypothetical protein [Streptomyces sp. LBL]